MRFGIPYSPRHRQFREIESIPAGAKRILMIGDSFTAFWPDSASQLLEEELRKSGVSTTTIAQGGYGPWSYLEELRVFAGVVRPDLVVVNFFVGNDVTDTLFRLRTDSATKRVIRSLGTHSFLVDALRSGYAKMETAARQKSAASAIKEQGDLSGQGAAVLLLKEAGKRYPEYLVSNLLVEGAEAEAALESGIEALSLAVDEARAAGSEFVLDIFPSSAQLSADIFPFFESVGMRTRPEFLTTDVPQRRLLEFCEKKKIRCFDLLPEFREVGARGFYMENEVHWNKAGNKMAFELLMKKWKEGGVLDALLRKPSLQAAH